MTDTISSMREQKLAIRRFYLSTDRDDKLAETLRRMNDNFDASLEGAGQKECALFLIGSTDSGKSAALKRQFRELPQFADVVDENGEVTSPLFSCETVSPCTAKGLMTSLLMKLVGRVDPRASDSVLTDLLKRTLKEKGIKFLHLDEAQHAVLSVPSGHLQSVRDKFKSLAQIEGWPLQLILSGTDALNELFDGASELGSRAIITRFTDLADEQLPICLRLIERIVETVCGLDSSDVKNQHFAKRLLKGCEGAFGRIILYLREACILALERGDTAVRVQDFIDYHHRRKGCKLADNPFHVALVELPAMVQVLPQKAKKRRKTA